MLLSVVCLSFESRYIIYNRTLNNWDFVYVMFFHVQTSGLRIHWLCKNPIASKSADDAVISFLIIFTNPSARTGYDTRSIFKRSLAGLNSDFSFSLTSCFNQAEELSLSYYVLISGGRIIGFIPFPRTLVLCEMLTVSSRIWTRVAVSISYDDNHYTTISI